MPFFIPIMIAATVASMIPSFLPQGERKRAGQVITQDGQNYYNRQTWRTGLPAGVWGNQVQSGSPRPRPLRPYQKVSLNPANRENGMNIPKIALIIGAVLGVIILIKVLRG